MLPPQSASSPRTTTFALAPFAGGWKKVGLSQCAQELAVPVELLATDAHAGARGNNHAFVSIARVAREGPLVQGPESGVMLSALQSTTDGGCLLRVVETAGQVEDVVIEFDRPVFAAQRVDLRGAPLGVLRYEQGRVYITLGSQRIENVLVKLRP
jgi:alpha-mannosidase